MIINSVKKFSEDTFLFLSSLVTTSEGMKALAKISRSGLDAIKRIQENKVVSNIHTVAVNLSGILTFFEPIVIVKEIVNGDKDGKRPWDHFKQLSTVPKGLSWILKKASVSIEFTKYLQTLEAIDIKAVLPTLSMAKSICNIGFATMTIIDKGIAIHKAQQTIEKLKGDRVKWINRKADWEPKDKKGGYDKSMACVEAVRLLCHEKLISGRLEDREQGIKAKQSYLSKIEAKANTLTFDQLSNHGDPLQVELILRDYLNALGVPAEGRLQDVVEQVQDTLVAFMTSVNTETPVELIQLMNKLPKIEQFINDPDNKNLHARYARWKTLEIYADLEDEKISTVLKAERFEQYYSDQVARIDELIANQNNVTKKSVIMIAFATGLLALGILSLISAFATYTIIPTLVMGIELTTYSIGIVRFGSDLFLKTKKEDESKTVELPNIHLLQNSF